MNFSDILNLIKKKDPIGLEQLYQVYGQQFYGYSVHRWKLNEDEAWDVVYKTLETLVLKLPNYEFESESHLNNFLYKVLINFLRQHFRVKRRSQGNAIEFTDLNDDTLHEITTQIDINSFNEYYKTETADNPSLIILNEALNKLDELDKDILLLRAQNYSYEEISNILKIPNNQLKVKHHRAKQKLMDLINKTDYGYST